VNGLDLFSGIGGLSIALQPWVRTVAYCECDRYAQGVLLSRMRDGALERAPIFTDVQKLHANHLPQVDIVAGGFPCQDLSVAGTGAGLEGKRSGLVFELLRIVSECRPRFVFLENVPALAVRGLDRLLLELDALGYDARWTIVSAGEVGAPHLRERIWILAHANGRGEQQTFRTSRPGRERFANLDGEAEHVDDALRGRHGVSNEEVFTGRDGAFDAGWWATEPDVGRVAHGVAHRVDRIRGLGNAVVPQAAREAFMRLMGLNALTSAKLSQGG
jgi:DNA (cytosine-5)-methyltransferase 1